MPRAGIEPARGYPRGILSPLRLPIPPPRQPFFNKLQVILGSGRNLYYQFDYQFLIFFSIRFFYETYKFRGFAGQTKHKKYRGHYEVSTKDFPINFSSILNWFYKWYERGLKSYYDSEKKQT